ncbi:hypothetical protein YW3DRAFT_00032 [Streptomyces sp. MnatMP-M77]|uniref:hypothetical protein n=1 Tax=unclassified Streptomyces TaxID=2593676 RepID=UPI000804A76C|nr:hypothetical protein [Streptomyces sp. MnatMP-M77]MYT76741.1 hypothetical protein [Streptomyces sp. SID8364]SBU87854.1 hypothetical protein YW3DRAFT_00032 [Streptomyces sp. MnatMP-M77]
MQTLYVADFNVGAVVGQPLSDPFEALLGHCATWLLPEGDRLSGGGWLRRPGTRELPPRWPGSAERVVAWEVEGDGTEDAVRIEVSQPLEGQSAARFVTRITVSRGPQGAALRVAMGKEVLDGWLVAQAEVKKVVRPGLIGDVLRNPALELSVLGQKAHGRYERIRDEATTHVLLGALAERTRLPIAVVWPRSDDGWKAASRLAEQLVGLAQVVTINYFVASLVRRAVPQIAVPSGGAALIWPGMAGAPATCSRDELEEGRGEEIRARWMELLGEVSVTARGTDTAWARARRATQRAAALRAEAHLVRARQSGDKQQEIGALRSRIDQLKQELAQWVDEAGHLELERDKYKDEAANAGQLRQEVRYWREEYEKARTSVAAEPDLWEKIPPLQARDAAATYRAIEAAADQRVVFTEAAERTWKTSRYPHQQEMTDYLVRLARAAVDLYCGEPSQSMPQLDTWFREEHGLTVAMSDQFLKTHRDLRDFKYNGKTYNSTPHVKVRDATSPSEVGRIYFALDSDASRFVIDHVGLKKY